MVSFALFEKFLPDPPPGVTLLAKRCLRRRLNTNQCTRCLDVCPSSALSLPGREIVLNKTKCTDCMACVSACPQDALLSEYDLEELLATIQPGKDLVISCARQKQNHPDDIVVPCVGIFSRHILATILLKGCGSARFNVAGCSECNNQKASIIFLADYKLVTETLSQVLPPNLFLVHQSDPPQTTVEGRRSYLLGIKENILSVTKKSFNPTPTPQKNKINKKSQKHENTNSRRVPYKTKLFKKLLIDLSEEFRQKIQPLLGYSLSVTEECTCCPLCKGICPTGAIRLERSAQGKKLRFAMQDCSGCGLCVEFCKKGAITLERNLSDCHSSPLTSPQHLM
ncbi:MAG: 4Fe-4S dicluster domain-containing protein [Desulfobulbaceae bacterium]|nr:4Fe-4S dicluster domain-containing protein [Desulfobulbaceae bacterium]